MIRKKAQLLGYVEAQDNQSAEAAAVEMFKLTDEQRKRLMITERH